METQILVTKQEPCIVYKRKDLANTTTTSVRKHSSLTHALFLINLVDAHTF